MCKGDGRHSCFVLFLVEIVRWLLRPVLCPYVHRPASNVLKCHVFTVNEVLLHAESQRGCVEYIKMQNSAIISIRTTRRFHGKYVRCVYVFWQRLPYNLTIVLLQR